MLNRLFKYRYYYDQTKSEHVNSLVCADWATYYKQLSNQSQSYQIKLTQGHTLKISANLQIAIYKFFNCQVRQLNCNKLSKTTLFVHFTKGFSWIMITLPSSNMIMYW